ncbi:MAG: hypothetical protein BMS9Abin29_1714 [Gemmatimonadota bacterium]|nr:MAG: hypothetical protein BMS9Abin29_1714 [Gemmatimonadota bacterium]
MESGWEAFQERFAPLVIVDRTLPGEDGLELCRRIRQGVNGDQAVILVVTCDADPTILELIVEAGANDYLRKPVDVALLDVRLALAEKEVLAHQERQSTQDALIDTTRELSTLFESLDEVFFSIDVSQDRLIQVSTACLGMLGKTPAELLESSTLRRQLLYPAGLDDADATLAAVHPGRSLVNEYPVPHPDGGSRWLEATLKPQADQNGEIVRIDGIISEVTERRRAQNEAESRAQELATLYHVSEITLAAESLSEAYADILEVVSNATGFPIVAIERLDSEREVMVITVARGLPLPEDGSPLEIPLHETLSGLAIKTREPIIERDARSRREGNSDVLRRLKVQTYLSFPILLGGRAVGTLTLASPERMDPPGVLVRMCADLAHSVAALTGRMEAADALRESEANFRTLAEKLQGANNELEGFAYTVSHDLRSPLRTMTGFAHALLEDFGAALPAEARDYAQRIIGSGQRAERLIRDLLAYSRLTVESVELQQVEVKDVIETVLEQAKADLDAADAQIDVKQPLPRVLANHITLVQALGNLVSNAIKFVPPERTPQVTIRAEDREDVVRLWVEDNGVGIPEGQEDRIFRVFERLAEGPPVPGTGIGLAIVRRALEKIGGEAGIEHLSVGSGFWIDLPKVARSTSRPWRRRRATD